MAIRADDEADATACANNEEDGEGEVAAPSADAGVAAEDGEEAKNLDTKESEREDIGCGGEAGGEDRGGHEGGVCAERGGRVFCCYVDRGEEGG